MLNYKSRVKYEGKEWLVVDAFTFEGKKYMYIVSDLNADITDLKDLEKYKKDVEVLFIENTSDNYFERVTDNEQINRLFFEVTKRISTSNT